MNEGKIRWLHLSDFHVGKDGYGQQQLFRYILNHVDDKQTPDFVFITGDVANRGQAAEYNTFQKTFLTPLQAIVGPDCRLFLVPGNHDVDREAIEAVSRQTIVNNIQDYFEPTANGLAKRKKFILGGIQTFCQSLPNSAWLSSDAGYAAWGGDFNGVTVGVLCLNTAWLSQDDTDKARLTPGKSMVEAGLQALGTCQVKLVLGHHPLDWLLPGEQAPIKALFREYHVIYLHGHLHNSSVEREPDFLTLQAGAAFQAREEDQWVNRFLWGAINPAERRVELEPYTWSSEHQTWVVDSAAYHPKHRISGTDWWAFDLPGSIHQDVVSAIDPGVKQTVSGVVDQPKHKTRVYANGLPKHSTGTLSQFKQVIRDKIHAELTKKETEHICTYLLDRYCPEDNGEILATHLCGLHPQETLIELLKAVKSAFQEVDSEVDKAKLKESVIGMMGWLLLLSVKDDWLLAEQYKVNIGTSFCVKIPVRTKTGLEIVESRLNELPASFKAGKPGHDLCGQRQYIAGGAEVGWDRNDVVDEVKKLLWTHFYKEAPPKYFTQVEDDKIDASLAVKHVTDNKPYLPIRVSDPANPLSSEDTYRRLVSDLPNLNVVFFGIEGEGVLVLGESTLTTLNSEILNYVRNN